MTTPHQSSDPTKPHFRSFSHALMRERARYDVTRAELAKFVGVQEREVKRWEAGEAIPDKRSFKRIAARLPRIVATPPHWVEADPELIGYDHENMIIAARAFEREHPEDFKRPAPISFGAGLKKYREENQIEQHNLGELCGVEQGTISRWEREDAVPVQENLDKLFQLLPELEAAVSVGTVMRPASRDIDKPSGNPFGNPGPRYPRAATIDTAVEMVMQQSDKEVKTPRRARPRWTVDDLVSREHEQERSHEHRFIEVDVEDEIHPADPNMQPVVRTQRRCAVCGVPELGAIIKKNEASTHAHSHRCPHDQRPMQATSDPDVWVCPACCRIYQVTLDAKQVENARCIGHQDAAPRTEVERLVEDYAKRAVEAAKLKRRASELVEQANIAKVNADTAQREADLAMELLHTAIAEEAGK